MAKTFEEWFQQTVSMPQKPEVAHLLVEGHLTLHHLWHTSQAAQREKDGSREALAEEYPDTIDTRSEKQAFLIGWVRGQSELRAAILADTGDEPCSPTNS